jgi:hypothetical protein
VQKKQSAMRQSKVFQILEHFNKIEQNRFRKYLLSPYFNKNHTIVALFELMSDELNAANPKEWSREAVWKSLKLPGAYDDVRMRKFYSDLLKHLEDYLILQEIEDSPVIRNIHLLQAIKRKKIQKLLSSTRKNIQSVSDKIVHRDTTYFLGQYLLEYYYDEMLTDIRDIKEEKTNLEVISKNIDLFYIGEKLRIYCEVLAKKKLTAHEYDISLMDEVIKIANLEAFKEQPFIAIYLNVYNIYTYPDQPEYYFSLKKLLDQYSYIFPKDEEKNLYDWAQNYCISQANLGNAQFLSELFSLYKDLLNKELLIATGKLDSLEFRNIVSAGLRLGEYEWVEKFIHQYNSYLPENIRENTFSFSLSTLYFYQKKYDSVIKILQSIEYDDLIYNINSKTTLVMTYYETGEYEPLYSLLESFRVYLNRSKELPSERKTNYKNFIKFSKKLLSIPQGDKKALQMLKSEVESTKGIPSRAWLLEKIIELS